MPPLPTRLRLPVAGVAGLALLATCAPSSAARGAAPDPPPPSHGLRAEADRIMRLDATAFAALRRSPRRPRPFDWTTDGCTFTPPPWAATFLPACRLHDFGYRNYGRGLRLGRDERTRRWVDRRFRREMLRLCAAKRPGRGGRYARTLCRVEATTMYLVVRGANYWGSWSSPTRDVSLSRVGPPRAPRPPAGRGPSRRPAVGSPT